MENYTKFALKPESQLKELLAGLDNIFVLACGKCYKAYLSLEEPELAEVSALAKELGKTVTGAVRGDFLCNKTKAMNLPNMIPAGTECVLVISCGLGVQTAADILDIPVYVATDTVCRNGYHGMALTQKTCGACAQCYLGITGGICPIVDCSKSLINGQCGGAKNGKCEVSPDKDCAWAKIQERLESQGRLAELTAQNVQIRDYSKINHKVIQEYVTAIRAERFAGYYGGGIGLNGGGHQLQLCDVSRVQLLDSCDVFQQRYDLVLLESLVVLSGLLSHLYVDRVVDDGREGQPVLCAHAQAQATELSVDGLSCSYSQPPLVYDVALVRAHGEIAGAVVSDVLPETFAAVQ